MQTETLSDFEQFRQMRAQLHQEENQATEAKLLADGTWVGSLTGVTPIDLEKLPHASVIGYRLEFSVEDQGVAKRIWTDAYLTPVSGMKGLTLPSKRGAQLLGVLGMHDGETFQDVMNRAKGTPMKLRIGRDKGNNGYKPKNTVWAITPAS